MNRLNVKSVLITGASTGIGKEVARQLALKNNIETIYLGVRNSEKGAVAQCELEAATNRSIFKLVKMDVADLASARAAVASLPPINALIMNAGGSGGSKPVALLATE